MPFNGKIAFEATKALAMLDATGAADIVGRMDESTAAGMGECGEGAKSVLDALVNTILSQNTTSSNSNRAFARLKERFPTWRRELFA